MRCKNIFFTCSCIAHTSLELTGLNAYVGEGFAGIYMGMLFCVDLLHLLGITYLDGKMNWVAGLGRTHGWEGFES